MKGEAAALSVRAQRCQSHYFSATPRIFKTPQLLHNQMALTVNRIHNAEQTVNCGASRSFSFVDRSIKRHFKLTGRYKLIKSSLHFQQSAFDNYKLPVLAQGTKLPVLAENNFKIIINNKL